MENADGKPLKPSSNVSGMVSKLAKVCQLRSIGVIHNENPNQINTVSPEETQASTRKIHPQPSLILSKGNEYTDEFILEVFNTVSSLKLAYVGLQKAHVPYNPDKILAADEHIVSQLEALIKIKRMYTERQFQNDKAVLSRYKCLKAQVEAQEKVLEKLKSLRSAKDCEIVKLRQKLQKLDSENTAVIEKLRQQSLERKTSRVLSVRMFEDTFKRASKSIHDFAKPIISLMKASNWDLDQAANSIENGVPFSKRSHKKYIFESYIARKMFHGLSFESYNIDDVMKFDDPIDSLVVNPNSGFANFCREKYLFVVHPVMEMSFFGNLDQRMFVLSYKHPRTRFYQIFVKMAKWIWVLRGIAKTIHCEAEMFAPRKGSEFSDAHMESVEDDVVNGDKSSWVVQLVVMPGFKIGDTVIKSLVYLSCTDLCADW